MRWRTAARGARGGLLAATAMLALTTRTAADGALVELRPAQA